MAEVQERLCERIELRQLSVFDGAAGLSEPGNDRSGSVGLGDIATCDYALAERGTDRWRGRTFTKDGAGYSDDPENGRKYGRTMPEWQVELPVRQLEENRQKRAVLSKGQQQKLLEWIRQELNYETLGYAVTLYTGIRIGELCALKWGDVDFEQRSICISKTIQRIYLKNPENRGNIKDGEDRDKRTESEGNERKNKQGSINKEAGRGAGKRGERRFC